MNLRESARTIFHYALEECRVEQAFHSRVKCGIEDNPFQFSIQGARGEDCFTGDLSSTEHILIIAAGKGAATMLHGLLKTVRFPTKAQIEGILIAPQKPEFLPADIQYFAGGHPTPNAASFAGAEAALTLLKHAAARKTPARTFCFFLISGGSSAMMELPLDASISLADTIDFYKALVHSGATISEINTIRKHFSAVKGGRLGQLAAALPNVTILVSDVPPTQLDSLGSGLTLPDTSSVEDCLTALNRHHLMPQLPDSILRLVESHSLPETPKPGSFDARFVTLLSSEELANAASRRAEDMGFFTILDATPDEQDYRETASHLLLRLRELNRDCHKRVCLVSSGEVTVRLDLEGRDVEETSAESRKTGIGGRNLHFALYTATRLTPEDEDTVVLSAGSDGVDGNSRFAGAVLGLKDLHQDSAAAGAEAFGTAIDSIGRFDSGSYLESIGATIETGPTGNNLRDLRLLLWQKNENG